MQLPRGRFETFVRGATINDIVSELDDRKFSGCCSGIFGDLEGEIIFDGGVIVLAESLTGKGPEVVSELFSNPEGSVTAELSQYNESQMKLAVEFNQKFTVSRDEYEKAATSTATGPVPEKKETYQKSPESADKQEEQKLADDLEKPVSKEETGESCLSIRDCEIESITRNFQANARDILRKVHLDHLIEGKNSGEEGE